MRKSEVVILLLTYTLLRSYGLDFGSFNLSLALIFSLVILRDSGVFLVVLKSLIIVLPSLFISFFRNGLEVGIYGGYEVLNMCLAIGAGFYVSSSQENETIKGVIQYLALLYAVIAVIQYIAPPWLEILIDYILYPYDGGREFRIRYAEAGGLRVTANFGASTAAGGHIFLLFVLAKMYEVRASYYLVLGQLLTFSRHSIILTMGFLGKSILSIRGLIILFLMLLVSSYFGLDEILLDRFSRGFLSDDNIRSRLIYGVARYWETMTGDLKVILFGLGPGFLYHIGDPNWNNYGYVSNGLLLFTLQYGWISVVTAGVLVLNAINFRNIKLIGLIFILVMADNYSFHSTSFHFLASLVLFNTCKDKKSITL